MRPDQRADDETHRHLGEGEAEIAVEPGVDQLARQRIRDRQDRGDHVAVEQPGAREGLPHHQRGDDGEEAHLEHAAVAPRSTRRHATADYTGLSHRSILLKPQKNSTLTPITNRIAA